MLGFGFPVEAGVASYSMPSLPPITTSTPLGSGTMALAMLDGLINHVACQKQCHSGKGIAIVTGANRGLGLGVARRLASEGFAILAVCRTEAEGAASIRSLANPSAHTAIGVDLATTKPSKVGALVAAHVAVAQARSGSCQNLMLLVNNAAVLLEGFSRTAFETSMAVNCLAPIAIARATSPLMGASGMVINVSSGLGVRKGLSKTYSATIGAVSTFEELESLPFDGTDVQMAKAFKPAYRLSKAALNRGTQLLASQLTARDQSTATWTFDQAEAKARSISVVAVCPGWCATRMGGKAARRTIEQGVESVLWPLLQQQHHKHNDKQPQVAAQGEAIKEAKGPAAAAASNCGNACFTRDGCTIEW